MTATDVVVKDIELIDTCYINVDGKTITHRNSTVNDTLIDSQNTTFLLSTVKPMINDTYADDFESVQNLIIWIVSTSIN